MKNFSSVKITEEVLQEIIDALKNIRGWGSVEIYVQDNRVVQITERNIKKTSPNTSARVSVKIGA